MGRIFNVAELIIRYLVAAVTAGILCRFNRDLRSRCAASPLRTPLKAASAAIGRQIVPFQVRSHSLNRHGWG